MVKVILTVHKAINWVQKDGNYFRGWFHDKDSYHEKEGALCFFDSNKDDEFSNKLNSINGNYACIYTRENRTYVAVDRIRSFPLFYTKFKNDVYISDDIEKLRELIGEEKFEIGHVQELMATGYVTGRKTLYKNIYQLQAGEYLIINNETGDIESYNHYLHRHNEAYSNKSSKELCKELDLVLLNVFKRLVESVKNKPIVLFLSGGYDSRLVAVMLKRLNYQNVYCISFGKKNNKEVIAAEDVAKTLGLKWEFITFPRNYLLTMLKDEEFIRYIRNTANGVCTPYYQGILAGEFIKRGLIPKDSVIVTGNSGDLLEGDQFNPNFVEGQTYAKDEITDAIISSHYMIFGKDFSRKGVFRDYISESIESIENKDTYTYEECHDILEFFNWRERQSKYVVNDVRCYDEFLGNEWRLPLWDSEFMDFWLKVPLRLRKNRKLYYEYVKEEKFLTANNPTVYQKTMNHMKDKAMFIIELLYPLRKLMHYFFGDSPLYTVNLQDYFKILNITKGYQTNTITTHIYMELNQLYKNRINSIYELINFDV